jgi:hypothetical protein
MRAHMHAMHGEGAIGHCWLGHQVEASCVCVSMYLT